MENEIALYEGTSVHDDLVSIFDFYASIEGDFTDFENSMGIHCPSVCGHCCERFVPDVTRLEALAIAFYMVDVEGRDLGFLEGWSRHHSYCPLYNNVTRRCTAYAVRPLVCRLFCSAASRTREGLSFRGCRLTSEPERMVGELDEDTLLSSGKHIPVMSDYGEALDGLQSSGERYLLDEAILGEASRLALIRHVVEESGDDDSPQAS